MEVGVGWRPGRTGGVGVGGGGAGRSKTRKKKKKLGFSSESTFFMIFIVYSNSSVFKDYHSLCSYDKTNTHDAKSLGHARRTHARKHARTHTRTHTHSYKQTKTLRVLFWYAAKTIHTL